jgi:hypothetical protein
MPADLQRVAVPGDLVPCNRAVLACLMALPQDLSIVLYWC